MKEKTEKEKKKYPYNTKRKIFQSPVANVNHHNYNCIFVFIQLFLRTCSEY